ncbi:S41 family peptidase [Lentisphaerota bacterium WC36G]|nr:PDZ domain-containing protein [Lentisphaerae bacterium WC36]
MKKKFFMVGSFISLLLVALSLNGEQISSDSTVEPWSSTPTPRKMILTETESKLVAKLRVLEQDLQQLKTDHTTFVKENISYSKFAIYKLLLSNHYKFYEKILQKRKSVFEKKLTEHADVKYLNEEFAYRYQRKLISVCHSFYDKPSFLLKNFKREGLFFRKKFQENLKTPKSNNSNNKIVIVDFFNENDTLIKKAAQLDFLTKICDKVLKKESIDSANKFNEKITKFNKQLFALDNEFDLKKSDDANIRENLRARYWKICLETIPLFLNIKGFNTFMIDDYTLYGFNILLQRDDIKKAIAEDEWLQKVIIFTFHRLDKKNESFNGSALLNFEYPTANSIAHLNNMELLAAYHSDYYNEVNNFSQLNHELLKNFNQRLNLSSKNALQPRDLMPIVRVVKRKSSAIIEAMFPDIDADVENLYSRKLTNKFRKKSQVSKNRKTKGVENYQANLQDNFYYDSVKSFCEFIKHNYAFLKYKNIDWKSITEKALEGVKKIKNDQDFGIFMLELVAKLEDSHSHLLPGNKKIDFKIEFPRYSSGFACLEDKDKNLVVYFINPNSSAARSSLQYGDIILNIDGVDVAELVKNFEQKLSKYSGWSSERYLHYSAIRCFNRVADYNQEQEIVVKKIDGSTKKMTLQTDCKVGYINRLPVQISGIYDSGSVSWVKLPNENIGYIYVRRIRNDLEKSLDKALQSLEDIDGLIIDVRGNSGGGFDMQTAYVNFDLENKKNQQNRPVYKGKIAILIDQRCISAGEGWSSWFKRHKRAKFFGKTTAGASARKTVYKLENGLFKVRMSVKGYCGFLDRLIERRGIEPDVEVDYLASDIAIGKDSILDAAKEWLVENKNR